jgi:hypothetical protein
MAPADVLLLLTGDDDPVVRCAVAENPNTPRNALAVLAEDLDPKVEAAALRRFFAEDEE